MIRSLLGTLILSIMFMSFNIYCSSDDINSFGNIDVDSGYSDISEEDNTFDNMIQDNYSELTDAFGSEFEHGFVDNMEEFVSDNPDNETLDILAQAIYLLDPDGDHPVADIMGRLQYIIDRIIHQDEIDQEPVFPYVNYSNDYENDFYLLFESIMSEEFGITDNVINIIRKLLDYIEDTYIGPDLDNVMNDIISFLAENNGQNLGSVLDLVFEGLGKLLAAANEDMWVDALGNLRINRGDIDLENDINTMLGNSTRGMDALLSGIKDYANNSDIEAVTAEVPNDMMRDLICRIEDYFTVGGDIYESNGGDNDYNRDNAEEYVNVELGNTLSEIMPILSTLLMRGDKEDSIINGDAYPIEVLAQGFNKMKLDLESLNLEDAIYKMIKYDDKMRDRLSDPDASALSSLEKLIFLMSFAGTLGYQTDPDPKNPQSDDAGDNHGRGHLYPNNGKLSLNDGLFNMTTADVDTISGALGSKLSILGLLDTLLGVLGISLGDFVGLFGVEMNAYGLAIDNYRSDMVHRDRNPFTASDLTTDPRYYYLYPNVDVLTIFQGQCIGDIGTPDGGVNNTNPTGDFMPYSADGLGDLRTANWMMGWIARACYEGEGPYYSTEDVTVNGNIYTYKSPNGDVYANIDKTVSDNWVYNDCNYKSVWNTDHYLIELDDMVDMGDPVTRYYPLDNSTYHNGSSDKAMGLWNGTEAGCLTISESVPGTSVSNEDRECQTYEEAIYKNFQWLLYDKKMIMVLPLRVALDKWDNPILGLVRMKGNAAAYIVLEAKGLIGLINLRKSISTGGGTSIDGNGRWVLEKEINGIDNYQDSTKPGDFRVTFMLGGNEFRMNLKLIITLINHYGLNDVLDTDLFFNTVLGKGRVVPEIIGSNINALKILGFFSEDVISSADAGIEGPYWDQRNPLLMIFTALLGEFHGYSSRETGKYPFTTLVNGLFPLLAKPLIYYQKDAGPTPHNCWKPRFNVEEHYFLKPGCTVDEDPEADWLEEIVTYYEPKANRTLLSMLSESEPRLCDGLISLLQNSNLLTRILSALKELGDSRYDDPIGADSDDYTTWGARRRILYGLEQIISTIKTTRGDVISRDYILNLDYPTWMFADDGIRPEDIMFDTIIDELIGSDVSGKGLAVFPDYREPAHPDYRGYDWDNFNRLLNALGEMMADGSAYNVMDDITAITDTLMNGVNPTETEIMGLRHTLGSVFAKYYEASPDLWVWEYPDEIIDIVTDELPTILQIFSGHYSNLFMVADELLEEGGLIEDLLNSIQTDRPGREVFSDLYDYLVDISDPGYALWTDLTNLLENVLDEWGWE
ncbi:MAG: hypothetical protein SVZ03_00805 [Spirochaetota bacterium]|nr:hypothetical protein [Spirochaetota bacterium]